jgi:long-chain acyl-CoA synthetase
VTPAWWQPRGVLRRFVGDLVADELARLRRRSSGRPLPWPDDLRLDADLGIDSLELLSVATALAEALHLHESGIEDYLLARRTLGEWVDVAQAGLQRFSERVTFRTSGSSGTPKPCQHTLASLRQETQYLATLFPRRTRVLCAVPCHHIYGFLFGVLLPRELGLPADSFVDLRASTPAWLARHAQPGDLVIGHPEFWAAVIRTVTTLPPDIEGVTSTAPCPADVAQGLTGVGLRRLLQVYGSSETGGIALRDTHDAPYQLLPYWRFDPAEPQWLMRLMPEGGVQAFPLQDRLRPCGERQIVVEGRHDEAVQVGGTNVFPARVRDVLCRHPGVQDATVRLMRPDEGTRLKAFVVPAPGAPEEPELRAELERWLERELTPAERPKALRLGPQLPTGATGKPADWETWP